MPKSANKYAACDMVARSLLALRLRGEGLSDEWIAQQCEVTVGFFKDQRARGFPWQRLRWKIESALGFRAIWSSGVDVEMRRRCKDMLGVDPRVITLKELVILCRRIGIDPPGTRQREQYYQALQARIAVHQADTEKTIEQKG